MRGTPSGLKAALLAVALLIGACGGDSAGDSVAGTYDCGIEGEDPREVWELREDGTLTITPEAFEPVEATWSVEGEQVIIHLEGSDDPFNVEGDRLVSALPAGPEGTWVCTLAD